MAKGFEIAGNVLLVYDEKIFEGEDYRINLKNYLHSIRGAEASCPVREGTHDFWVTYGSSGHPNFCFEDMNIKPRPLRGIVEMGTVPMVGGFGLQTETIQNNIATLLQEVGHHWLVWDLSIQKDEFWPFQSTRPYQMPRFEETSLCLQEDKPFYGVPLAGRDNTHWSSFFKADLSAFDGINWENVGEEDGSQIWRRKNASSVVLPRITADGISTEIELRSSYNDLDLLLMGVKTPSEAYRDTQNKFKWLRPRLTAPLNYFAGLFIAFSENDFIYFGFYKDHRQIASWSSKSSDDPTGGQIFPLTGYRPLADKFNSVALRMVRRGDSYFVQARLSGAQDEASLLEGIRTLPISPPGSPLDRFQTLAEIKHTGKPKAIGLMVRSFWTVRPKTGIDKAGYPLVCDAAFKHIELLDGTPATGSELIIATDKLPPSWTSSADGYDSLPDYGSVVSNRPIETARITVGRGSIDNQWLHIVTPYLTLNNTGGFKLDQLYDHTVSVDEAPKVLTRAPNNRDFAVATIARINHCSFCPWIGGVGADMQMWGDESMADTRDVFISDVSARKQTAPDPEGKYNYKIAFIIIARKKTDISDAMVSNIDVIRRYWDAAFDNVTLGRRHSYSKLT